MKKVILGFFFVFVMVLSCKKDLQKTEVKGYFIDRYSLAPIANGKVSLVYTMVKENPYPPSETLVNETMTDENGYFKISTHLPKTKGIGIENTGTIEKFYLKLEKGNYQQSYQPTNEVSVKKKSIISILCYSLTPLIITVENPFPFDYYDKIEINYYNITKNQYARLDYRGMGGSSPVTLFVNTIVPSNTNVRLIWAATKGSTIINDSAEIFIPLNTNMNFKIIVP